MIFSIKKDYLNKKSKDMKFKEFSIDQCRSFSIDLLSTVLSTILSTVLNETNLEVNHYFKEKDWSNKLKKIEEECYELFCDHIISTYDWNKEEFHKIEKECCIKISKETNQQKTNTTAAKKGGKGSKTVAPITPVTPVVSSKSKPKGKQSESIEKVAQPIDTKDVTKNENKQLEWKEKYNQCKERYIHLIYEFILNIRTNWKKSEPENCGCIEEWVKRLEQTIEKTIQEMKTGKIGWNSISFDTYLDNEKRMIMNITKPLEVEEGIYSCPRCKGRKTHHYSRQVRSADEPATVFITCANKDCQYKWKIN